MHDTSKMLLPSFVANLIFKHGKKCLRLEGTFVELKVLVLCDGERTYQSRLAQRDLGVAFVLLLVSVADTACVHSRPCKVPSLVWFVQVNCKFSGILFLYICLKNMK